MHGEFVTDGHLGGYIEGGDPATLYPDLWAWLVDIHGVESVLDVGCGDGAALSAFRALGCDAIGIDGVPQDDPDIIQHDFTTGPLTFANDHWNQVARVDWPEREGAPMGGGWRTRTFDLVWCCEVVEHVEEQFLPNLIPSLLRGKLLLLTHAEPGQQGWHHVNCRTSDYWVGALAGHGLRFDDELTRDTRALAAANANPSNHYARSGLAFRSGA